MECKKFNCSFLSHTWFNYNMVLSLIDVVSFLEGQHYTFQVVIDFYIFAIRKMKHLKQGDVNLLRGLITLKSINLSFYLL